jgi:putative ABC transport system substrate-binding protein
MMDFANYVSEEIVAKTVEIVRELVPGASKIALLVNPDNPMCRLLLADEVPPQPPNLGVVLPIVKATTAEQIDIAVASAAAQYAHAIS